jgi:DNA-binding MarR family transcriptional regulator
MLDASNTYVYNWCTSDSYANDLDGGTGRILDTDARFVLGTEIRILVSILTRTSQRALERRLSAYTPKVSGLQYGILCALSFEEQTIAELSQQLMRNPSTFVPAVDALERKGLIRRGRDPEDRRRTPLAVTESGRKLLADVPFIEAGDPLIQGLDSMGQDPAVQLLSLLHRMVAHLPEGQEIVRSVQAEMRMRAQCPGKEVPETARQREWIETPIDEE